MRGQLNKLRHLTRTLYELFLTSTESMLEMVAFSEQMLEAGYLMPGIQVA